MEYALYKGEELITIGTIYQIAKETGVEYKTIQYLGTGAYKRKLEKRKNSKNARILVRLDNDDRS